MLPPATRAETAAMIMTIPNIRRGVSASPKTVTPKNTAVRGSSAPSMAVGVDPIYCIACVVQRNDMAVGKSASATRLPHLYHAEGNVSARPKSVHTMNIENPNTRA